jgi:uncharacterized protein YndB with AHSA1/START domain
VLGSGPEVNVPYESFSVSEVIPADPERIYAAWLNSEEHTAFTGDHASIEPFVGGKHSAFAGYAVGATVELLPGRRIVQTWRATDFPPGSPDSRVEVTLEATVGGTMVTIFHTEIPTGQSDSYRDSWVKYYLEPLKNYFSRPEPQKQNGVPTVAVARARTPKVKTKAKPKAKARRKANVKARPKAKAKAKRAVKAKAKPKARKRPAAKRSAGKKPASRKRKR